MFRFDAIDFQRIAVSSIGALVLSVACIVGAVGPARAADGRMVIAVEADCQPPSAQYFDIAALPKA